MRKTCTIVLIVPCVLALLQGCERKTPEGGSTVSPNAPAATTAAASAVEMVLTPGGKFTMGDKDEADATPHEVTVSPFHMDKHLVTQELYQKVMGDNPSRWKQPKNPVESVRWSDAVKFCNARSKLEGLEPCYNLETWECNFGANG